MFRSAAVRTLSAALIVLSAQGSLSATSIRPEQETLLLQEPSISRTHVVFVYARDLWVAPRNGGLARRLTSNTGVESGPQISPDGQWVAFTGQYEGNTDVYLIPIEGGTPKRLTWHPGGDSVLDWHPDGRRILFSSRRGSNAPVSRLHLVSIDGGGIPEELIIPKAAHASFNASGTHIAYTPFGDAFRSWKRYRGGRIPPVWIIDLQSYETEQVPHVNASDTFPCWLGDTIYFASDRDNQMNLYSYQPGSKDVEQISDFDEFDIRSMDAGGGALVLEQGGALHVYDPKKGALERLRIRVIADGLEAMPRWKSVSGAVRASSIAPNGKRAVFEARGEIITVPREHGDSRNLSNSPGEHDRNPIWSPDGEQIAWFCDASGEYELIVTDRLGRDSARHFDLDGGGFYYNPQWSPDGKHILFADKSNRLAYVTLETGAVTQVADVQGSLGVVSPTATWSPDSKWIAFGDRNPRTLYDQLALFELESGKITPLTDDFGATGNPAFSADNKHLFFTASVDIGPKLFGLDMSTSAARNADSNIYVAVLQKDGKNPLFPKSDEAVGGDDDEDKSKKMREMKERSGGAGDSDGSDADAEEGESKDEEEGDEKKGDDEKKSKGGKKKEKKLPNIDLAGLDQRILSLPLSSGLYANLACTKDKLLFVEYKQGGGRRGGAELKGFDFDKRKAESLASGVSGFQVSADRKWLLTSGSGGTQIRRSNGKDAKSLDINSVTVRVEPEQEWPQILREVWRIQRDYFYDENMHGVDWPAMWDRWQSFLPHVKHRDDLNVLIWELIGELACGHQYAGGGDRPSAPKGVSVGLLGCDWSVDSQRYRIDKIYRGQNWNPGLRAPLTEPGVDARAGDYLITVNGRPVMAEDNLYQAFENTSGKQVEITLASGADGNDARTMTVVPIGSEGGLRRMSWIESNRQRVDELSDGRLAYIYMPNTGGQGMAAFDRDFYSQIDKQGVILDERYNGGGKVADYVIDVLSREVMSYWMNREKWVGVSPFGTIEGPKVMVINEHAGSGGDWMPWAFQNRKVGQLVGTRTWGGLVGISGYPVLMDGGSVTAANFGVMDPDGNWAVENVGVSPDHEVIEWPDQIIAGRDPQLEKAVELALAELENNPPKPLPEYKKPAER